MYTALVADGNRLPPVVFTSDPNIPRDVAKRDDAVVIYIPNLSTTPSANITLEWHNAVKKYIPRKTHFIHDAGGEFTARKSQDRFKESHIISHQIPGAGGAFVNPCDATFHHDLKHHYYSKTHNTHAAMINTMIDAYYEVPSENIVHYFIHTRIIGPVPTLTYMKSLLSEGYRPGRGHEELHQKCRQAYLAWKKNMRNLNNPARMNWSTFVEQDDTLDGVYWYPHCNI